VNPTSAPIAPRYGRRVDGTSEIASVWLTGPPAANPAVVARVVAVELGRVDIAAEVIDPAELEAALGPADTDTAVSRAVWLAARLQRHGVITLMTLDLPTRASRAAAQRALSDLGGGRSVEIFLDAAETPDTFEEPILPPLRVPTSDRSIEASAAGIVSWIETAVRPPAPGHR
jgi:adenylylsulfate kinase-like enzyme